MEKRGVLRRMIIGFPLIIASVVTLFFVSQVAVNFSMHSQLDLAITIDFLLVIPLLYFLTIRKTSIPNFSVVPVLILCMLICGLALPTSHQGYLSGFKKWVFPFIELAVLSFVLWKVRKIIVKFRAEKSRVDFYSALRQACTDILPKAVVAPFVTEIAVFYYGFIAWKKPKPAENEFTYHHKSGTVTLLVAIIGVVAIEMVTVHVLLGKWSATAAWILTVLSMYSAVQLLGFAKGVTRRPIVVENETLKLRYSFLKEAEIPLEQIKTVRIDSKDLDPKEEVAKLSLLHQLEGHNVILELTRPATLCGMYGTKKEFSKIALHLDDEARFANSVTLSK